MCLIIIESGRCCGAQFVDPDLLSPLPLPTGPMIVIFQAGDDELGGGVVLKVGD